MTSDEPAIDAEKMRSDIAGEMVRVHEESYGTGASNVDVHLSGDIVLVILDIELTAAEQTLINAGHGQAVKVTRESFQEAIAPTFEAIVEHATGRKVGSFLNSMSVDPAYAMELFRLEVSPN